MSDFNGEKYPIGALKPKAETGVINFLAKYPKFNGDNVTIAILDSGVDPNAAGLKVRISLLIVNEGLNFYQNSRHYRMANEKSSRDSTVRVAATSAHLRLLLQLRIQSLGCRAECSRFHRS